MNHNDVSQSIYLGGLNMPTATDATYLYRVIIVDKTVKHDDAAVDEIYVRAKSEQQARVRAVLRHDPVEDNFDDYDFIIKNLGVVSEVDADAE